MSLADPTSPSATPAVQAPALSRGWLFGPALDSLLIANIAWPVLAFLLVDGDFERGGLRFWQIYYITTPHRWITLALVFLDRERLRERPNVFLAILAAVVAVCLGVRFTTGALTCLLAIDYLWNAWHFAAQHHGVYRLYRNLGGGSRDGATLEKVAMRGFLLYVILRVASSTWAETRWTDLLRHGDWIALALPTFLLTRDLTGSATSGRAPTLYLISTCSLYGTLLWAVHQQRPSLVLALATASAIFHALEYLALAGWSVRQRFGLYGGRLGMLGRLALQVPLAMGLFIIILGAGASFLDQHAVETWLTLNVIVAFLHYAYDGLIWRGRSNAA